MMIEKKTTIQVTQKTKDRLAKLGYKGDSFEDIIKRCATALENEKVYGTIYVPMAGRFGESHPKTLKDVKLQIPKKFSSIEYDANAMRSYFSTLCEEMGIRTDD